MARTKHNKRKTAVAFTENDRLVHFEKEQQNKRERVSRIRELVREHQRSIKKTSAEVIFSFRNGPLCNKDMSTPVVVRGRQYACGRDCLAGEKLFRFGEVCVDPERQQLLMTMGDLLRNRQPPYHAFPTVEFTDAESKVWNEMLQFMVQKEICEYKYTTYPEVRSLLARAKNKLMLPNGFVDENKPNLSCWAGMAILDEATGNIRIVGENKLGKIWMEIRDRM